MDNLICYILFVLVEAPTTNRRNQSKPDWSGILFMEACGIKRFSGKRDYRLDEF